MARILGIDLGTTNSCVAVAEGTGARVLATPTGERTIPSVVAWPAAGPPVVGAPALRQAVSNASATIYGSKRLIGKKVNSDDVSWFARSAPFRVVAAANGDAWVRVRGAAISPQEIASLVLRRVRECAEGALGEPVTRAVITVPAYFDDVQRQATRDAGAIAGLDVVRLLNEPTAAALAYGAHRVGERRRTIAVFDLGGGTFDVSIMAVEASVFEVLATSGDTALGGEDWDRRITERLADELFDQTRVDVTSNPVAMARLREAVEEAKKALSSALETTLHLPFLIQDAGGQPINFQRRLTRDELEAWTRDLVERLEPPVRAALRDAGLEVGQIEEVLLVGGMTRWPVVQAHVEHWFGKKPSKSANPDEVVALGAATYASILAGASDEAALLDVTPLDIGLRVGESQFLPIIARNSMLPVRARKLFTTTSDDQAFVAIDLYQGEHADVQQNRKLGQVVLEDLPPGPAGSVRIELILTVDVESILHATARELSTGRNTTLTVRPSGGLSQREIVEIIARRRAQEAPRPGGRVATVPPERG